jgi:hypothetical protein
MKYNKRTIAVKIETVSGTDAVPTGALNAVQCNDLKFTPIKVNAEQRNLVRAYFGNSEEIVGAAYGMCEFGVEYQGSGSLGVPGGYGPLLRACAHQEVIVPTTSVAYNPITDNEESATIYYAMDGNLYKLLYCKGTVSVMFDEQKIPHFMFKMTGLRVPVVTGSISGSNFTLFKKPLAVNKANTVCTFHGQALAIAKFSIDVNNTVGYVNRVNAERTDFTSRETQGSVTFEETLVSVIDFYDRTLQTTLGALSWTHGTVPGLRGKLTAPNVQVQEPPQDQINNVTTLSPGLRFMPNVGNDEYQFLFD